MLENLQNSQNFNVFTIFAGIQGVARVAGFAVKYASENLKFIDVPFLAAKSLMCHSI